MSISGIITLGLLETPSAYILTIGLGDFSTSVSVGCVQVMAIYQPGASAMQVGCC